MGHTGRIRFEVWLSTTRPDRAVERTRLAQATKQETAFARVCEIIQQWAASEGAITPGTVVSIKDTNDGGTLFSAEYLGFEVNLLGRESQQWPEHVQAARKRLKSWPR